MPIKVFHSQDLYRQLVPVSAYFAPNAFDIAGNKVILEGHMLYVVFDWAEHEVYFHTAILATTTFKVPNDRRETWVPMLMMGFEDTLRHARAAAKVLARYVGDLTRKEKKKVVDRDTGKRVSVRYARAHAISCLIDEPRALGLDYVLAHFCDLRLLADYAEEEEFCQVAA